MTVASCSSCFLDLWIVGCRSVADVEGISNFDKELVQMMRHCFQICEECVFALDRRNWKVKYVLSQCVCLF